MFEQKVYEIYSYMKLRLRMDMRNNDRRSFHRQVPSSIPLITMTIDSFLQGKPQFGIESS